jgi:hypothetical protein
MPQHHPNILELLGDASHSRRFIRWRDVVRYALQSIGNEGSFLDITEAIEKLVPAVWRHRYWEARVLRIVRKDSEIEKIRARTLAPNPMPRSLPESSRHPSHPGGGARKR